MPALKNIMEDLVKQVADEVMIRQGICRCAKCFLDVSAIALNRLPPRYVVTSRGEAYSRTEFLDMQNTVDIMSEVIRAVEMVKTKPHHES